MRLFLLTVLAFVVRLQLFLSSEEPTGWDGYSYVVQVERLVSEGRLHWPDASWVTYFLGALHVMIPSASGAILRRCGRVHCNETTDYFHVMRKVASGGVW